MAGLWVKHVPCDSIWGLIFKMSVRSCGKFARRGYFVAPVVVSEGRKVGAVTHRNASSVTSRVWGPRWGRPKSEGSSSVTSAVAAASVPVAPCVCVCGSSVASFCVCSVVSHTEESLPVDVTPAGKSTLPTSLLGRGCFTSSYCVPFVIWYEAIRCNEYVKIKINCLEKCCWSKESYMFHIEHTVGQPEI